MFSSLNFIYKDEELKKENNDFKSRVLNSHKSTCILRRKDCSGHQIDDLAEKIKELKNDLEQTAPSKIKFMKMDSRSKSKDKLSFYDYNLITILFTF